MRTFTYAIVLISFLQANKLEAIEYSVDFPGGNIVLDAGDEMCQLSSENKNFISQTYEKINLNIVAAFEECSNSSDTNYQKKEYRERLIFGYLMDSQKNPAYLNDQSNQEFLQELYIDLKKGSISTDEEAKLFLDRVKLADYGKIFNRVLSGMGVGKNIRLGVYGPEQFAVHHVEVSSVSYRNKDYTKITMASWSSFRKVPVVVLRVANFLTIEQIPGLLEDNRNTIIVLHQENAPQ